MIENINLTWLFYNCGEPRVHQKENREGADLIGYVDKTCDMAQCNAVFDSGAACGSIDAPHGGKHTYRT